MKFGRKSMIKRKKSLKDKLFLIRYPQKWEKLKEKEKIKRYSNKKALLYSSYASYHPENNEIADTYFNGNMNYILKRKYCFDKKTEVGNKYLVINSNNEYCGTLEVTSEEFLSLKDLKAEMVDYKLAGYKTFEEYKKHLYHTYQEKGKMLQEEFTEDSLLSYLKVKVLEKF